MRPVLFGLLSLSTVLGACSGLSRVTPAGQDVNDPGDVGTTLPNDPVDGVPTDDDDTDTDDGGSGGTLGGVAAGLDFTCVVGDDAEVACFGKNDVGQSEPNDAAEYQLVVAGQAHACGLTLAGTVFCWGDAAGAKTTAPEGTFTTLSAGPAQTCALDEAGAVTCWGVGPTPTEGLQPWSKVAVGGGFVCGLERATSALVCFGSGVGVTQAPVDDGPFTELVAGSGHACVVDPADQVTCWGANNVGQATAPAAALQSLSAGATATCGVDSTGALVCWGGGKASTAAPATTGWSNLALGTDHGCGLRSGELSCWGDNDLFQGQGPITGVAQVSVGASDYFCVRRTSGSLACFGTESGGRLLAPAGQFADLQLAELHACALTTTGGVSCWGSDAREQVSQTPTTGTFATVGVTRQSSCAIRDDGAVVCWANLYNPWTPIEGDFVRVDGGDFHACAIEADGAPVCWGSNGAGQRVPPPGVAFDDISAGVSFTCGVTAASGLSCWGDDTSGRASPPSSTGWSEVSAGTLHACALADDGGVECWGDAGADVEDVPSGEFVQLSAGTGFTCAVRTDGRLRCWGNGRAL